MQPNVPGTAIPELSPHSVGIAVVGFNPETGFADRFAAISAQAEYCLLVDNSDTRSGRDRSAQAALSVGAERVENPCNRGVAAGINQAISWAVERHLSWLLLLDQDTGVAREGLLAPYRQQLAQEHPARVAAIGLATGSDQHTAGGSKTTDSLITSGTLFRLAALMDCGGAWEELFIDGVDREMCIRLRSRGWQLRAIEHPAVKHCIGEAQPVKIFGRVLYCNHHPPLRRYYSVRNRMLIARRHRTEFGWYPCLREDFLAPWFEGGTFAKLGAALLGLWHGARGIGGPAPKGHFLRQGARGV